MVFVSDYSTNLCINAPYRAIEYIHILVET